MMDVEKAFNSLDHTFLILIPKKFGFGQNFISWIEIILKNQEPCVINSGTTTKYFKQNRGSRQGDRFQLIYSFWRLKFYLSLLKKIPV